MLLVMCVCVWVLCVGSEIENFNGLWERWWYMILLKEGVFV